MSITNQIVRYNQYNSGEFILKQAQVISENQVSLTINGEVWVTLMCTPIDLEALAIGFAYNEGLINSIHEVDHVHVCGSNDNVDLWLTHEVEQPNNWRRTSGCTGGITSILNDIEEHNNMNGFSLPGDQVCNLINGLFESQDLYRTTGGVHTSALCDGTKIHIATEDIGRHNTLDKLAGHILVDQINIYPKIILTTGRISSEMLQKSAKIGAAIVISRTSPTILSINLAEKWGITLIGYARRNQFNTYTHPQRISINTAQRKDRNVLSTQKNQID